MSDPLRFVVLIFLLLACTVPLQSQQHFVPDQYGSIQSAIDAAAAGDTVMVRAGSYHEFLVLRDGVVLRAEGEDDGQWNRALRTIIHSEGLRDGNGDIPPVVNCADGAVLDGFTVTGMDTVNHHLPGHSHAVQNRGTSSTIMNCIVHSNGSTGIGSHDKDGREANPMIIHNMVYRNFGIGIGFNHTSKGEARDNVVYENREVGIGIQNGASPVIAENHVYKNGWNGISAREGAWPDILRNSVSDNGVDPTGEGVPPNAGAGIGLDSTGWIARPGAVPQPVHVAENNVGHNPSGGIMSRNSARFLAERNRCSNNGNFQISVTGRSDAVVRENDIFCLDDTLRAGGIVIAGLAQARVTGNSVRQCATTGIAITQDAIATIDSNSVMSCERSGIHVDGSASAVIVKANAISGINGPALIVEEGSATIERNVLVWNGGGAIFHPAANVHFTNNTVLAEDGATGRGIAVNGRSGSTCYNNIVVGYSVGFFLEENPVIDYNCTFANQGYNGPPGTGGAGAISTDPFFKSPAQADFHLSRISPCIDAGHPDAQYNDPDGTRNDMGAYPFDQTSVVIPPAVPASARLVAYPTTTQGRVDVMLTNARPRDAAQMLSVHSVTGARLLVAELQDGYVSLDLRALPSGMYFLRVMTAEGPLSAKVQVMH